MLKKRSNGILIFLTMAVLAFLVYWSFAHQNIGKVTVGGLNTSWLWLPLVLFWIWNVLDARTLAKGKRANLIPLILLAAIILYVIALNVTGVRINRLIKRFLDAKTVYVKLLNPDVVTISINGQDQICACKCLYTYVSARLDGEPTEGTIRLSNNFLTIMGQVREQPVPTWKVQPGLEEAGTRQDTLQYHKAGTVVAAIVIVVALMDFASARLRQSFI